MVSFFGLNPRKAFIGLCITTAAVDFELDEREIDTLSKVLIDKGFTEKEINSEWETITKNVNIKQAMRYCGKCFAAIPKMDKSLQDTLLKTLTTIAFADGELHKSEDEFIQAVAAVLHEC